MKHRLTLISFFSLVIMQFCSGQSIFPDSIVAIKTEPSNRLKGTRVFLTIPASYKLRTGLMSYLKFDKDSLRGMQVIEYAGQNFYQIKHEFTGGSLDRQNTDTGINKAVKVDGFDGVYYTGPIGKIPGAKVVFLVFGDTSFTVAIDGNFPKSDKVAELEINTILKTAGFDKSVIVDPLELVNFRFDKSITGFKYVPSIGSNEITYASDGIITSIDEDRHKSSYVVASYKSIDIESAKKIVESKIGELTEFSLSKVNNISERNININSNTAYEMTMDEQGSSVADTKFYIVIIQKDNEAVLFWGVDRDGGKWIEKFKATAQSIIF